MNDDATFAVLDPEFWVSLEQRAPGPEYRALLAERLAPDGWRLAAKGVWTHAHPPEWNGARQGWKLHVSATPANAPTVLERVAGVLRADPAAFKTASDPYILSVLLSRNWPRSGGGKFVTVYPADEAQFRRLGAALAEATAELDGPYILSDRRVPGSRIVFYRYGEHLPSERLDPRGYRVATLSGPKGEEAADGRAPHYQLPAWLDDPYGARPVQVLDPVRSPPVLADRYEIARVLKHSNLGGVYAATDRRTGARVVVRERRPLTGWIDGGTDAVALLHREARVLQRMEGTGVAPRYVDAFPVWEHHFLVMEHVDGVPLRDYALSSYFRRRNVASPRRLFWLFRRLVLELLGAVEAFHARGIVIRDLSVGNVLVRRDRTVCLIDFEYAWERDGQQGYAAKIQTPGFASPDQVAGRVPTPADDFYALGGVMVELCCMLAPGLGLNRAGMLEAGGLMMDEVGLPRALLEAARGLLEPDPALRWTGDDVRRALAGISPAVPWRARTTARPLADEDVPGLEARVRDLCESLCRFFEGAANPQRADALFPASPEAYRTNAVGIHAGACGPVELVRRMRGAAPDAWLDWTERMARPDRCPPGLHAGLAGVAVTLAASGRTEAARALAACAAGASLLPGHAGLYHGAAGVGLAALALGTELEDDGLRGAALRTAEALEEAAERLPRGIGWRDGEGVLPCGLARGAAGVALFHTYLGACTGQARYWTLARQALEFELSLVQRSGGLDLWPAAQGGAGKQFRSPHLAFGTAGLATAAVRLYACTGDETLRPWLERCGRTLSFRWTNKLWQDMGYAGWGETLLDLHAVTGDARHRTAALRIAEILLPMAVRTRLGTAFPGGGLNRVSSDFGMGASGIALFLHRLVTPGASRAFYPDHLLGDRMAPRAP
jgi:hypothetical protein